MSTPCNDLLKPARLWTPGRSPLQAIAGPEGPWSLRLVFPIARQCPALSLPHLQRFHAVLHRSLAVEPADERQATKPPDTLASGALPHERQRRRLHAAAVVGMSPGRRPRDRAAQGREREAAHLLCW